MVTSGVPENAWHGFPRLPDFHTQAGNLSQTKFRRVLGEFPDVHNNLVKIDVDDFSINHQSTVCCMMRCNPKLFGTGQMTHRLIAKITVGSIFFCCETAQHTGASTRSQRDYCTKAVIEVVRPISENGRSCCDPRDLCNVLRNLVSHGRTKIATAVM